MDTGTGEMVYDVRTRVPGIGGENKLSTVPRLISAAQSGIAYDAAASRSTVHFSDLPIVK